VRELLEKIEAATGPDREIDTAIWLQMTPGATRSQWSYIHKASGRECFVDETRDETRRLITTPAYTASIDAAVGLVERMLPGRDVNLEIGNVGPDRVTDAYISGADGYFEEPKTPDAHGYGLTPALALCAALIRALIEQENRAPALTEREG